MTISCIILTTALKIKIPNCLRSSVTRSVLASLCSSSWMETETACIRRTPHILNRVGATIKGKSLSSLFNGARAPSIHVFIKTSDMPDNVRRFIALMKHPVKFRMFLFSKLPSAYFAGVRLHSMTEEKCEVSVPYKWFSQNPFRSTYFACLSMAAEMSTGALAMAHTYKIKPAVSMLVTRVEGDFIKKAVDVTTFLCEDGEQFQEVIRQAIETG